MFLNAAAPLYLAARLRWLPLWILGVGLALTAVLGLWAFQREAAARHQVLQREAQDLAQDLQHRLQAYIDTLPGLRVFGVLRQSPSDAEFRHYVQAISLVDRYPGLAVTFIAELVDDAHRADFEAAARNDRSIQAAGHPGFAIVPAGRRPQYMALRHLHPEDPQGFGYDLFDPAQNYRGQVDAAIDSGRYVATGPLQLARDRGKPRVPALTAIVVRAALYRGGVLPATEAARRQGAFGVAGIGFRIEPLVKAVLSAPLDRQLRLRLVDEQAAGAEGSGLLYDSEPTPALDAGPVLWSGRIAVADRQWTVTTWRRGALGGQDSTWMLLLFGAGLSLALAGMTRGLVRANLGAEGRLRDAASSLLQERDHLRQSEARFRMLFEHSFDAVLCTRPDGAVLAANAAACALFGGTEAQLQALRRGGLVDPSDERLAAMLSERDRSGRVAGALRMRRIDGSQFEAEISSNLYIDGDGQRSTSMIIRDLTERQRLAQRLQERQRLEAIGTLAGGVAHDFNNMLAAILGNVALAEHEVDPRSPALQRLRLMRRAAERARSLVRQILTFGRRAPKEQAVQPLQPLIDEAVALLRSTLPPTVDLRVDGVSHALWVRVDGAQAQQMLLNLCTNAWQALPGERGEIRVELQPCTLSASEATALALDAGDYARLRVQDNGQGMDEAVRSRIFEPFFTTKPLGQGTGLGLAVVHGVVTENDGAIRVDSTPGQGTCITVYLPLLPAPAGTPAVLPERPALRAGGAGQRVLYVDDDEVVALTAQALLARAGYAVSTVADAPAALQALRDQPDGFAALVTDFNMPGMSGLALCEAVREACPAVALLVLSGLVTDELQARAREIGICEVLPKAEMLERMVDAVDRALGERLTMVS